MFIVLSQRALISATDVIISAAVILEPFPETCYSFGHGDVMTLDASVQIGFLGILKPLAANMFRFEHKCDNLGRRFTIRPKICSNSDSVHPFPHGHGNVALMAASHAKIIAQCDRQ